MYDIHLILRPYLLNLFCLFGKVCPPPPPPSLVVFICKFESNFMKTWFNGCLERLKNGEDSGFEFSKWGKGDSYELYHPFQIHVPKYQIKLVRGLGTEPPKLVALMCAH